MSKDGGAAFPFPYPGEDGEKVIYGMTMRQWYKGMALQGLLARGAFSKETIHLTDQYAGAIADAMIAEDAEFDRRADERKERENE